MAHDLKEVAKKIDLTIVQLKKIKNLLILKKNLEKNLLKEVTSEKKEANFQIKEKILETNFLLLSFDSAHLNNQPLTLIYLQNLKI